MNNIEKYNAVVPENIRMIMQKKCFKQRLIAEKAGIGEYAFADMLNGRRIIKPCDIILIAGAMEVDAGELFGFPE